MDLKNGYKVIYEKVTKNDEVTTKTLYATKDAVCDPTTDEDVAVAEFVDGAYKLIYEKDGKIYGSETGIPTADDKTICLDGFNTVFVEDTKTDSDTESGDEDNTNEEITETPDTPDAPVEDPVVDNGDSTGDTDGTEDDTETEEPIE